METVKVNASKKYEVRIGSGLLPVTAENTAKVISGNTVMAVSDDTVFSLYGEALKKSLVCAGYKFNSFVFPHGEQSKNLTTYGEILNAMYEGRLSRADTVIALGGGVTGDMAGFAAATYQRGINFIQLPTTLLAAVDSSVGGKTGVDLPGGKNQVGAFYQPSMVLCDTDTMNTLPVDEYRNGCAEIIKYAMIGSEELFYDILNTPVCEQYEKVISKCVSMKRDYVERDEHDLGLRMMLNFGHTVGHAVETCSSYTVSHGKAVAIGMALITKASCELGLCSGEVYTSLTEVLKKYGLPISTDIPASALAEAALTDKKRNGDSMTLVVPEKTGVCVLKKIHKNEFSEWLKAGGIR